MSRITGFSEYLKGRCVEFQTDSFMIDCLEREDATIIVNDHDLHESDLLVDLMVLAARAAGSSMSATERNSGAAEGGPAEMED